MARHRWEADGAILILGYEQSLYLFLRIDLEDFAQQRASFIGVGGAPHRWAMRAPVRTLGHSSA